VEIDKYQAAIRQFAIYPESNTGSFEEINYLILGLLSESGELAGKWKKLIRDGSLIKEDYWHELGDVLWYLTQLTSAEGMSLHKLAEMNYNKLSKRKQTDTLGGSGDHREEALASAVAG
jgi:NTP pyrophosphatase (non-canonical NTP hydrolase)